VDGRPYADQEFLTRIEEYHQAAAVAHRTHGKVPLVMPPAPSPAPVAQGAVVTFDSSPGLDGGSGPNGGWAPGGDWAPGSGPAASP
jgi:hypothetical protein